MYIVVTHVYVMYIVVTHVDAVTRDAGCYGQSQSYGSYYDYTERNAAITAGSSRSCAYFRVGTYMVTEFWFRLAGCSAINTHSY